jgi:glutathione synthase
MKLAFIVSRASAMTHSFTTIQLAVAALALGHSVGFIDRTEISIQSDGLVRVRASWFEGSAMQAHQIVMRLQTRKAARKSLPLWEFDQIFLRTRPLPVFLQSVAMMAVDRGIPIVNDPVALMRTSSKGWLASLEGISTPETLITSHAAAAEMFFQRQPQGVIVKPGSGAGGQHVTQIPPGAFAALHDTFRGFLTRGVAPVVIQSNIGVDESREKRLMWLDGEVIGGYQRARASGEFRHNLSCGAEPEPLTLTKREKALIAPLSPHLLAAGIRLSGIDLLGPYILEVNVLNPGGAFHADRLNETCLAQTILQKLLSPQS